MSTFTPNYNLEKPDSSDQFGLFRQLFNDNMDKIDNISGGSGKILKNQTLNFVGLVATVSDSDIDTDSDFAVFYYNEQDAEDAQIEAVSSSGTITFTAQTAPQNTITCDIVIFSANGGGGSSTLASLTDVNLTTPTDGQVLTYDGNSSKWVNTTPSGGTINYSTSEQVIGTWTDGKTLYQTTVHINALPATPYTAVDYPHGIANIETICWYEAMVHIPNSWNLTLPRANLTSSGYNASASIEGYVSSTNIRMIAGSDRSNCSADFTIRYTKTS